MAAPRKMAAARPSRRRGRARQSAARRARAAMPHPFDTRLDLQLIELVKKHPHLYDDSNPKYARPWKDATWKKIGKILDRPAAMCKSRWVNMRDMMRRKLNLDPARHSRRYLQYKYSEELAFVRPFFNASKRVSDASPAPDDAAPPLCKTEVLYFSDEEDRDGASSHQSALVSQDLVHPVDVFLSSVGATLRQLSPYYLNQAKTKIFQVVQEYELQQIVEGQGAPQPPS